MRGKYVPPLVGALDSFAHIYCECVEVRRLYKDSE